ncbi:hypothetical protein H0A36_26625 [Endozoicomonas sp. SM1973]|uniref:Uncharacterized protein n=1 Tax=Spartinivicinus marinus TaxID=2994442 RepID=A0A853IHT5_9GAMM|nr:hypothetical protein [Spartinivicinus marinus]NYZ69594.1 hypothetical protein [Spartinivicinus marinus]
MSFDHKAYILDYEGFSKELKPLIEQGLLNDNYSHIRQFILNNKSLIKDPYEGMSLSEDWEDMIETRDAHQYGDFALTKFYDPSQSHGFGDGWEEAQDILLDEDDCPYAPVLGDMLGAEDNFFDPGQMGSYFKSPDSVNKLFSFLSSLLAERPELQELFQSYFELVEQASRERKGLYITF